MRKTSLTLIALVISLVSFAQKSYRSEASCPKLYMGISSGIENPVGLIGFNIDVPVVQSFSLGTGFGRSSWGWKTFADARFYFGKCNSGWALGTGVTYNTGIKDFVTQLPTTYGDRNVTLDFKPKVNAFFAAYKFWHVGHKGNRIYINIGYSFRLDDDNYTVKSLHTLTDDGKQVLQVLAPGGLMIGFGFNFAVVK